MVTDIFETDRLKFSFLSKEDAKDIFSYCSQEIVSRYCLFETHKSIEDSLSFIQEATLGYVLGELEPLAIRDKETGRFIGTVGAYWRSQKNLNMEIAYIIAPEYWGKGFVVEALNSLMDYYFTAYGARRIQARCHIDNIQSKKVMVKLGLYFEGNLRAIQRVKGKMWDMSIYSMTLEDWLEKKRKINHLFIRVDMNDFHIDREEHDYLLVLEDNQEALNYCHIVLDDSGSLEVEYLENHEGHKLLFEKQIDVIKYINGI